MAKHDKLNLTIAKAERNTDFLVLKYSSTERGKVVDVTVKDIDGTPYDLSGFDLEFVEELYNGNIIVDDGSQDSDGSFAKTDLKQGKFSYQFQDGVYQYDGWAHFKFKQNDNLIDTTEGFAIKIIDDIDADLDEKSYIAYYEKIKSATQTWENQARDLLKSAQALNDGNYSKIAILETGLDGVKQQINNLSSKHENDKNALSSRLDSLNQEKDTLKQRVNSLDQEKNALKQRIDSLDQEKNNLNTQVNNLKNKDAELEREIEDAKIPTFNTLSEYQTWAQDHPNKLAYVLDDTK